MRSSDRGIDRRQALILSAAAAALPLTRGVAGRARAERDLPIGRNQPLDFGWKFSRAGGAGCERPDLDDRSWRTLDLPHDWSIEDLPSEPGSGRIGPFDPKSVGGTATGYTDGGEGWYRRHFRLAAVPSVGHAEVFFDGVYRESDAWLNGHHLGRKVHGYTPFSYDLTPHLRPDGDNVLVVRVRNLGRNSRWYSGSGIYRSVTLDVLPERSFVQRWGVGIVTRHVSNQAAEIQVETRLTGIARDLTLASRIRNAAGVALAEAVSSAERVVNQKLTLTSPQLWSPESPTLYQMETELRRGSQPIDRVLTQFGVRIVTFDAEHGMRLNGKTVILRGGCVHHDNGLLGAAAFPDAEERRIRLLKARGFNAIRSAHNPASAAFADACDRLGMLLIEEAFDAWQTGKNPQDYSVYFAEYWREDLSAMVLSARNHPSVILWSIGNEIPDRCTPEGVEIAWNLANEVHRLDPTRPVTAAINGFAGRPLIPDDSTARRGFANEADQASFLFLDVGGYNYKPEQYESDHGRFPRRVMLGTESFPKDVFDIWRPMPERPYVLGDVVWAAIDYLGEAGIGGSERTRQPTALPVLQLGWPWVVSFAGDLDLTGRQKPSSRARDVAWGVSAVEMAVQRPLPEGTFEHTSLWGWPDELESWSWPGFEGYPVAVRVYTRADRIDLLVNGNAVATKSVTVRARMPLEFRVEYVPGRIEAVAYKNGAEIGRRRFDTVGRAAAIRLRPEQAVARAKPNGLSYVHLEVVDAKGRLMPDADVAVGVSVRGPATLVGFGSGVPLAVSSFQSDHARTHRGHALAILRFRGRPGVLLMEAHAEGLEAASTRIRLT